MKKNFKPFGEFSMRATIAVVSLAIYPWPDQTNKICLHPAVDINFSRLLFDEKSEQVIVREVRVWRV